MATYIYYVLRFSYAYFSINRILLSPGIKIKTAIGNRVKLIEKYLI